MKITTPLKLKELQHDWVTANISAVYKKQKVRTMQHLNVSKSPGPDGLHPRILYETSMKITTPLKTYIRGFP